MWIHQTSQKCSSWDSDDVLKLFRAIGLWFTETFSTFPKTTSFDKEEAIPARHVPVWALKKCCCFSERNPIWPPLPLICCDISDLLPRASAYELAKLSIKKYSSKGSEEVLILFRVIRNLSWSPWALIGWEILNFFMKTFSYEFATLARNVPLGIQFWWTVFASESKCKRAGLNSD